jgi:hypothetical protein
MRTVPVHVMWDTQEKITSRPENICGMPRTARGASYGGETLCVDGGPRGIPPPSPTGTSNLQPFLFQTPPKRIGG